MSLEAGPVVAPGEGPLVLRWHEFSRNIGASAALFRRQEVFADLTLVVEGERLQAHRFILASCSPLFLELLRPASAHPHPLLLLRGVRRKQLAALLDFMYHGEVSVEQEELAEFLRTAEELQVKGLTERPQEEEELVAGVKDESMKEEEVPEEVEEVVEVGVEEEVNVEVEEPNPRQPSGGREAVAASGAQPATKAKSSRKQGHKRNTSNIDDQTLDTVSGQQRKVSGMLQSAISQEQAEIEVLQKQSSQNMVTTIDEQNDLFSSKDSTDDTISEVERMLQETKQLLRPEEATNADIEVTPMRNQDHINGKKEPVKRKSNSEVTNGTPKARKKMPGGKALLHQDGGDLSATEPVLVAPPDTPAKQHQPSEKDRKVIACLVAKLTGTQGWRCTMCRQVFASKPETEDHVGTAHVFGQLTSMLESGVVGKN
jgi:hypothetical protein